mgnify:CR=1 FL=1
MIRGDYINHGLPEKHKKKHRAAAEPFPDLPPRASVGGGVRWQQRKRNREKKGMLAFLEGPCHMLLQLKEEFLMPLSIGFWK